MSRGRLATIYSNWASMRGKQMGKQLTQTPPGGCFLPHLCLDTGKLPKEAGVPMRKDFACGCLWEPQGVIWG